MTTFFVDGEKLELPASEIEARDALRASGLTNPDRYDLLCVDDSQASHVVSGRFTPNEQSHYVSARKSTTTA